MSRKEVQLLAGYHKIVKQLVFWDACVLTFCAGLINVKLLTYFHVPVSHMSGAVSIFSIDLGQGDFDHLGTIFSMIFFFAVGAALAGLLADSDSNNIKLRWPLALGLESLVFLLVWFFLKQGLGWGVLLAALGCGFQNAVTSYYMSFMIRTTHMTGLLTDLGYLIGRRLGGEPVEGWKFTLLVCLMVSFALGGFVATSWHSVLQGNGTLMVSLILAAGAVFHGKRVWQGKK